MPDNWDYSQRRPARVDNSAQMPLITYLLCGLSILLTAALWTSDSPEMAGTFWYKLGHFGVGDAGEVWGGHYGALFTSIFYHKDLIHLAFNLLWVFRMGSLLEATLHPLIYALFVAASAAVGSAAELGIAGDMGIGLSGVGYAMFGLMWSGRGAHDSWRTLATRENLNLFLIWGVFCIVTTVTHILPVANGAHFGGLLFGLSLGWMFIAPRRQMIWGAPLAALLTLCTLGLFWMPWSGSWSFNKGLREIDHKHNQSAIYWFQRSITTYPDESWHNIAVAWSRIALEEEARKNEKGAELAFEEADKAFAHTKSDSKPLSKENRSETDTESSQPGRPRPILPGKK